MTTSTSNTTSVLRKSTVDGITIEFDPEFQRTITKEASDRLGEKREWFKPGTDKLAYHLSDLVACIRKGWFKYQRMERNLASGLPVSSDLTPAQVIRFGRGYGMQDVLVGDVEEAVWDDVHELYFSPDGGVDRPIEIKTSLAGPLVAKERKAGLSYEDVLNGGGLRDTYYSEAVDYWREYMLAVMHLMGWNYYYLVVVHWMSEELMTYRVTATPEKIASNWAWLEERLGLLKGDALPSWQTRRSKSECERCEFLERCIGEGVLT